MKKETNVNKTIMNRRENVLEVLTQVGYLILLIFLNSITLCFN